MTQLIWGTATQTIYVSNCDADLLEALSDIAWATGPNNCCCNQEVIEGILEEESIGSFETTAALKQLLFELEAQGIDDCDLIFSD